MACKDSSIPDHTQSIYDHLSGKEVLQKYREKDVIDKTPLDCTKVVSIFVINKDNNFDKVYNQILSGCEALYKKINKTFWKKDKIDLKNSLSDISHQLKTPLTSIFILLDNILDDPDMPKELQYEFLKDIKREYFNLKRKKIKNLWMMN